MSHLEDQLMFQLAAAKIALPQREYRFAAIHTGGIGKGVRARLRASELKDWRFDLAWPELKLAVEVEGGTWSGGRHTRGKGFEDDCIKYNAAMLLGWNVARFTSGLVKTGKALETIELLLNAYLEQEHH